MGRWALKEKRPARFPPSVSRHGAPTSASDPFRVGRRPVVAAGGCGGGAFFGGRLFVALCAPCAPSTVSQPPVTVIARCGRWRRGDGAWAGAGVGAATPAPSFWRAASSLRAPRTRAGAAWVAVHGRERARGWRCGREGKRRRSAASTRRRRHSLPGRAAGRCPLLRPHPPAAPPARRPESRQRPPLSSVPTPPMRRAAAALAMRAARAVPGMRHGTIAADAAAGGAEEASRVAANRLLYRASQRGLLELDIIIGKWTAEHVKGLDGEGGGT